MRWLLGVLLLVGGLAGAVGAAGYYLLPTSFEIVRTADVSRPRATLFALVSNLRAFNEFSPWHELDPQAEYAFEGAERGVGQKMAWTNARRELGPGSVEIVGLEPNVGVDFIVDRGKRGSGNARIGLTPKAGLVEVSWRWRAQCGATWRDVPCRYIGLFSEASIGADLDRGLLNLRRLAEALPSVDFEGLTVEYVTVTPVNFAYVENTTAANPAEIQAAMRQAFALVTDFLRANGLREAGPPLTVTLDAGPNAYAFRAGAPFEGAPTAADPRIRVGPTPGGAAVKVVHVGGYDQVRTTYARLDAYLRATRLKPAGGPWEVYLDVGLPPEQRRTEIYFALPKG